MFLFTKYNFRSLISIKLGAGCFGAALMLQPDLLAELGERFSPSFTHLLIFAPPALLTSLRGGYLTHFLLFPLLFSPLLFFCLLFFPLFSTPFSSLSLYLSPHTVLSSECRGRVGSTRHCEVSHRSGR